jgi:hypothetical protein
VYYSVVIIIIEIDDYIDIFGRSWWPRSLRPGSAAARLLGLWVRILGGFGKHWCLSFVGVVCCQVQVSATSRSPPIPTEYVCLCLFVYLCVCVRVCVCVCHWV